MFVSINQHVLQRIQFDWQTYLKNIVCGPRLPCSELGAAVRLSWRCEHIHSQSWQNSQVTLIHCIINLFILYSLVTFWNLIVKILTGICIYTRLFLAVTLDGRFDLFLIPSVFSTYGNSVEIWILLFKCFMCSYSGLLLQPHLKVFITSFPQINSRFSDTDVL